MSAQAASTRLRAVQETFSSHSNDGSERTILFLPDNARTSVQKQGQDVVDVLVDGKHISSYIPTKRQTRLIISAVGTPFEGKASHIPAYNIVEIRAPSDGTIAVQDMWATIYVLFTLYASQETIPILLSDTLDSSAKDALRTYILSSGLGRTSHTPSHHGRPEMYLMQSAFWQSAGTYGWHPRSWLPQSSSATKNALGVFPNVQSFTRSDKVIAAHPLRPQKPRPGEVLYRRFCVDVNSMLEFTYFDLRDGEAESTDTDTDIAAFHRWHNSPRVDAAWGEAGTLDQHRQYMRKVMDDPAVWPIIMKWNGERMGYLEIVWIKENHVATFVPDGAKDWDRGIHILVGEERFRGRLWAQGWYRSLLHYCFLADPRTERVIGEPRAFSGAIIHVSKDAGMDIETLFDFPYKRCVMTWCAREKWFKLGLL